MVFEASAFCLVSTKALKPIWRTCYWYKRLRLQVSTLSAISVVKNELRIIHHINVYWRVRWLDFSESTSEGEIINPLWYRQTAAETRMANTLPRHSRESERVVLDVSYKLPRKTFSLRNSTVTLCRTVVCFFFNLILLMILYRNRSKWEIKREIVCVFIYIYILTTKLNLFLQVWNKMRSLGPPTSSVNSPNLTLFDMYARTKMWAIWKGP